MNKSSTISSLDSDVRVGTFLHTSATSELEWDWEVAMDEKWFVHSAKDQLRVRSTKILELGIMNETFLGFPGFEARNGR